LPESKLPSAAETVCATESTFVQVTIPPVATV
jgi:hypothetical protein